MKTIKSCKFNIYLNKESVLELDGSETHNVFARPTSPHKQVYSSNHMRSILLSPFSPSTFM